MAETSQSDPSRPPSDGAPAENAEFTLNAWRGGTDPVTGRFAAQLLKYATSPMLPAPVSPMVATEPKLQRWDGEDGAGWTLVLRYDPSKTHQQQATPDDAPPSIQCLWRHRGCPPILRHVVLGPGKPSYLRRYRRDDDKVVCDDYPLARGTSAEELAQVPFYLLLVGPPKDLPWSLQYTLNGNRAVGRLDLTEGEGLKNYVERLIHGWEDDSARASSALLWSVDHKRGERDITQIMRTFIGDRLDAHLDREVLVKCRRYLGGSEATAKGLDESLRELKPGLIVTTSHGAILGSATKETRRAALGLPVDQTWTMLDPDSLLKGWQPAGAVWYAHACCSAGSDTASRYDGLVVPDCDAAEALRDAGELGETVAPLPRLLLGASRPLRAFIGHVGPTFSWTLRERRTRQPLTAPIVHSFYTRFYQNDRFPVGHVIRPIFEPLVTLLIETMHKTNEHRDNPTATCTPIIDRRLMAEDLQSTVLIGDPTALIPPY
jgi:hypothetical protein